MPLNSSRSRSKGRRQSLHGASAARISERILVVEDSVTSRALLQTILERAGYLVQTAVDGMEALAMLKEHEFDMVVSDVDMPRMNGFTLTEKIRADVRISALPVVLVTSLDSPEDQKHGITVGADAYIMKTSFEKSRLLEVIRSLLEQKTMKILVVEDSRTQAESLRYILEKKGYGVALATNGRDALEQIRASRPDLVLTDIVMPEMDGYELCRRIKTTET